MTFRDWIHPCRWLGHDWREWVRYYWLCESGERRSCVRCNDEQFRNVEWRELRITVQKPYGIE